MAGGGVGFNLGLQQGMHQGLVLTPELRMAIRILGMTSQELTELIGEQALENPLLEYEVGDDGEISLEAEAEKAETQDWTEYFLSGNDRVIPGSGQRGKDSEAGPMDMPGLPSGYASLLEQAGQIPGLSDSEAGILKRLILSLDPDGYLSADLSELSGEWDIPVRELAKGLECLQTLEPRGVGARNLRECLLLQLRGSEGTLEEAIVRDHLEDMAEGRFKKVSTALKCGQDELKEAITRIRGLNPKPGLMSGISREDSVSYIRPDVHVHRVGRRFVCTVNESLNPRVRVNREYAAMLRKASEDEGVREYVRKKASDAVRLAKNIEQRRLTILRVAERIVGRQEDFMRRGMRFLHPMTLKDIGNELDLHESTVSRAVSGKYMSTPHGLFEMRFFFTSGVSTAFGEDASSESVKKRIGELVGAEVPDAPLTDDSIACILKSEGTNISRRTVAKYRDSMGVLPSSKRRVL